MEILGKWPQFSWKFNLVFHYLSQKRPQILLETTIFKSFSRGMERVKKRDVITITIRKKLDLKCIYWGENGKQMDFLMVLVVNGPLLFASWPPLLFGGIKDSVVPFSQCNIAQKR